MNKIIMNDTELKSLKTIIEYLLYSEEKHYEESEKNEKDGHIYQHTTIVRDVLKNTTL